MRYILSIDAGTTSNRAILFDPQGSIIASSQKEFTQHYPQPGWVEHDPLEIWQTTLQAAREAIASAHASPHDIAAIGITNQRETTVLWERSTGRPIHPAIVWQCRRATELCDALVQHHPDLPSLVQQKTGLILDPYFSGPKIRWILDHVPGASQRAQCGEILFGTIETWLLWNLTGGSLHITDYSNASRTMLFNIHSLSWDEELLHLLDIPRAILPEVRPSSQLYAHTSPDLFGAPIPLAGAAGDQQAALFGQQCWTPGSAKNTYGTGCFLLLNTGSTPVPSQHGLVTTIAWGIDNSVTYALEGSVFVAGAAIQWLRDELGLIQSAAQSETLAQSVPHTNGCIVVPAFTGLGAPHWKPNARGIITGITRGTQRAHIVRATLDSIALQVVDILDAMREDSHLPLTDLKVDGGAAANAYLMQTQADLAPTTIRRPSCIESTALGAAYLAGLATGFWESPAHIQRLSSHSYTTFEPSLSEPQRRATLDAWHEALRLL